MKKVLSGIGAIFNLAVFIFGLNSIIWMFKSYPQPEAGLLDYLKYFTVLSNLLIVAVSLIIGAFDLMIALGARTNYPKWVRILSLAANVGTTITMLTVVAFLGPTLGYGFMYGTYNLYMHLITPLLGLIAYLFFTPYEKKIGFIGCIYCTAPLLIYGIAYIINVASHNGYGTTQYDWYGFGRWGLAAGIFIFSLMLVIDYSLGVGMNYLQRVFCKVLKKKD